MRIRRIRLVLPARLRPCAARDGRAIAEAAAEALARGGRAPVGPLRIEGAGRTGTALAMETAARLAPGKQGGQS